MLTINLAPNLVKVHNLFLKFSLNDCCLFRCEWNIDWWQYSSWAVICDTCDGHKGHEIRMAQLCLQSSWHLSSLSDHAQLRLISVWKANILRENLLQIAIIWVSDKHIITEYHLNMARADILWQTEGCKNVFSSSSIISEVTVTMSRPSSLTRLGSLLSPNSPRSFRKHVKLDFPDLNGEFFSLLSLLYARWQM